MHKLFIYLSFVFLLSCGDSLPGDSQGEKELASLIEEEVGEGFLILDFEKSNGLKKIKNENPYYIQEFKAKIQNTNRSWFNKNKPLSQVLIEGKDGEQIDRRFSGMNLNRLSEDYDFGWGKAIIEVKGEFEFEETENGWRRTDEKVSEQSLLENTRILNEHDNNELKDMLGYWKAKSRRATTPYLKIYPKEEEYYVIFGNETGISEEYEGMKMGGRDKRLYVNELDRPIYFNFWFEKQLLLFAGQEYELISAWDSPPSFQMSGSDMQSLRGLWKGKLDKKDLTLNLTNVSSNGKASGYWRSNNGKLNRYVQLTKQ